MEVVIIVILAYSSSLTVYTLPNTCCYNNSYLTSAAFQNSTCSIEASLLRFWSSYAGNLVVVLIISTFD